MLFRLGGQIRSNLDKPDYVHEALKTYLMLGGAGPLDKDLVRAWMDFDWKAQFPGPDKDDVRNELAAHLNALLEAQLQPIGLDGTVIDTARRALLQSPLASRAYNTLKQSAAARKLPEWRIAANAGPAADRVFVRNSGKLLSDGIPGLYTYQGFYQVFLPGLASVSRDVARESWVLGDAAPKGGEAVISSGLQRDIAQLYANDYITQWDGLLADVAVVPFRSMQNAAEVVNILSAPTSPLKLLLTAAAKETQLSRAPDIAGVAGDKAAAALQNATAAATGAANKLAGIVGQSAVPSIPSYGQPVDDHFRQLQQFVGLGGQGPAPIDDLIRGLNDVYLQLNRMGQPGQDLLAHADGGAVQKLATDATHLPSPVAMMVAGIARGASTTAVGGARVQINDDWQSKVLPFCQRALDNRYPIIRGSQTDVHARRLRQAVRAQRTHRRVLQEQPQAVRRHVASAVALAEGRQHRARHLAGCADAVPACRGDPRRLLRRWRRARRQVRAAAGLARRRCDAGADRHQRPGSVLRAWPAAVDAGAVAGDRRHRARAHRVLAGGGGTDREHHQVGAMVAVPPLRRGQDPGHRIVRSAAGQFLRRRPHRRLRGARQQRQQSAHHDRAARFPLSRTAMSEVALAPRLGFFGKLPARGDFVTRRLTRDFTDPWDGWLQDAIAMSAQQLGADWLDTYLTAPIWRFLLSAGVCGRLPMLGVMMPSVDRVGRYFPLTLAVTIADSAMPARAMLTAASWFDEVEQLALSALEDDADLDRIDREAEAIAPPTSESDRSRVLSHRSRRRDRARRRRRRHGSRRDRRHARPARRSLHAVVDERLRPLQAVAGFRRNAAVGRALRRAARRQMGAVGMEDTIRRSLAPKPSAPPSFRLASAAATHAGKVRKVNEDAFLERPDLGLWAVADGVGGAAQGDRASRLVVEALGRVHPPAAAAPFLAEVCDRLKSVNGQLQQEAAAHGGDRLSASTVVALLAFGQHFACAWAGDSRLYLLRDYRLQQISRDHSEVQELVDRGMLTPEQARTHPHANVVTRAVGAHDNLVIDMVQDRLRRDDVFLLCSDGLTKMLEDREIAALLGGDRPIEIAVEMLLDAALDRGATDNVTVVGVQLVARAETAASHD